jgi:chromosome segregation ATPase
MVEESGAESPSGGDNGPEEDLAKLNARVTELEQVVAGKDDEIAGLRQTGQELEKRLTTLNDSLSKAVASYKAAVVRANPEVIEELITGDTIQSIEESLDRAKELVSKVRRGVESEISLAKVPAGAPERTSPDLSTLSPREKIQYAIGKK